MFQTWLKQVFANRKKYAHILAAVAASIGVMWSTSEQFRVTVKSEVALMPHWVQGLGAVLTFVIPLYKTTRKILDGGAQ